MALDDTWQLADRAEMPSFCLMVGCSNDKKKCPHINFCGVPKVTMNQGKSTKAYSEERQQLWLAAISGTDPTKISEND